MNIIRKTVETIAHVMPDRTHGERQGQQHRYIGEPVDRVDGRDKVTGRSHFSAEYPVDGMLHAFLVYSTISKGKIVNIDIKAAEAAPGVVKVITHENAPHMMPAKPFSLEGDPVAGSTHVPILNTAEISWDGQPVAMVVADTEERAREAASLVKATYEAERGMNSFEESIAYAKKPEHILGDASEVIRGNADDALRDSPHRVDLTFTTPPHNHNAIEPHATIAWWEGDSKVTMYDTSQFTVGTSNSVAQVFGLKKGSVRLIANFVGGGFGGKGGLWPYNQLCVLAAKVTGKPVRLVLTRAGVFRSVGGRTPSQQRVAIGADAKGKILAFIHEGVTAQSTDNNFPEQFSFPPRHLYSMSAFRIGQKVTEVNRVANTFMRAPGESIGTFAMESALDALAYELKMDPVELRLRNEPDKDPVSGHEFSIRYMREAYLRGAEKFGWSKRPAEPRSQRDGRWLIGQGVATGTYPVYRFVTSARIRLNADGTAVVQCAAQEMGMGTATVQTQHAAELLGLPMEKVRFEYGDSTLPAAGVAGGSSQTVSLALAIQKSAAKLIKQLLRIAQKHKESPLSGVSADDVQAINAGLYVKDRPERGESFEAILRRADGKSIEAESKGGAPTEIMKYSMHSYAAQFCEVRVNERTGEVRINRFLGSFDTGRILNPKTAVSQFRGGIIMGIGMALTEETMFDDRTGRIVNPSLAEYHVPVQADIPEIEVIYTDLPDPKTSLGAHGIGEIGITGVAAAVANAVFHATGRRVTSLPITLDKLL
jgi:xanthine dehydrogenase YagR molybdenum-binding subunit